MNASPIFDSHSGRRVRRSEIWAAVRAASDIRRADSPIGSAAPTGAKGRSVNEVPPVAQPTCRRMRRRRYELLLNRAYCDLISLGIEPGEHAHGG